MIQFIGDLDESGATQEYKVVFMGSLIENHNDIIRDAFHEEDNKFYSSLTFDGEKYILHGKGKAPVPVIEVKYLRMAFTKVPRELDEPLMRRPFYAEVMPLERTDKALNVRFLGLEPTTEISSEEAQKVTRLMRKLVFHDCNNKMCDAALYYNNKKWLLRGFANNPLPVVAEALHEMPSYVSMGGRSKRAPTLDKLTVKELRERCARRGIAHSGKRKAELVATLRRKGRAT